MAQLMDTAGYSLMCEDSSGVTLGYGPYNFSNDTYEEGYSKAIEYIHTLFKETLATILVGTKSIIIFKDTVVELICIKGGDPGNSTEAANILWACSFSSSAGGTPTAGNKVLYFGVNNRNIQLLANEQGKVTKTLLEEASELVLTLHSYNGSVIPISDADLQTFNIPAKDSNIKMIPIGIADDGVSLKFKLTLDNINETNLSSSSILFTVSYLDYTGTFILNLNVEQKPFGHKLYTIPNVINIPVKANPLAFNLMVERYDTEGKTVDLSDINSLFAFEGVYIDKDNNTKTITFDSSTIQTDELLNLVNDNLTGSIEFKCYDKITKELIDSEVVQIFDQRTYTTTNITLSYPSLTITLLNDSVVFSSKFKESADDTIWKTKTQATVLVKNKEAYMSFTSKNDIEGKTNVAYINSVRLNGTTITDYVLTDYNSFCIPKDSITSDCIIEALINIIDAEGNTDDENWVSLSITILDKVITGELSLNVIPDLVVSSAGKPIAGFELANFEIWDADTDTRYTNGSDFFKAFPNAFIKKDRSEIICDSTNPSFTYKLPVLTNSLEVLFTLYNRVNDTDINYGTLKIIYTSQILPESPQPTNKIYIKYKLSQAYTTEVLPPSGVPKAYTNPATNLEWGTWSDPSPSYPLVWQSQAIYNSEDVLIENWTKPVVINANNQLYKYKRFSTLQNGNFSYREDDGWSDTAQGVNSYDRYEYVCIYNNGSWSNAVIWAAFGETGPDGSSTEYIYKVFDSVQSEADLANSGYRDKLPYWVLGGIRVEELPGANKINFDDDDYIPKNWSDNPLSLSLNLYLYVCTRKKRDGIWDNFSDPVLWSSTGKNGDSPTALNIIRNSIITINNEDNNSNLRENYTTIIAQKGNSKLSFSEVRTVIDGKVSTTDSDTGTIPDLSANWELSSDKKELYVFLEKSTEAPNILNLQNFEIKVTVVLEGDSYEIYIHANVVADSNYYLHVQPNKIYTKADGTFDLDIHNPILISAKRKDSNLLADNFRLSVEGAQNADLDTKNLPNSDDLTFRSGILTLSTGFQRLYFCDNYGKPVGNTLTLYVNEVYLDTDSIGVNIKGDPGAAAVNGYTIELSNNIVYLDDDLLGEANCLDAINKKISPNITVRKGTETKNFTLTLATIVLETALLKSYLALTAENNPNKNSILTVSKPSGADKFPGGTLQLRYKVLTLETDPVTIEIDLTITILDLASGVDSQTININYAGNIPLVYTNTGYAMQNLQDTVDVFLTKLIGNNLPLLLKNLGGYSIDNEVKVPNPNSICLFVKDNVTPTLSITPMEDSLPIYANAEGVFTLNRAHFNTAINSNNKRLVAYQYTGLVGGNLQWTYLDSEALPFVYIAKDGSDAYEVEVLNDTIILDDDCELSNVTKLAGSILVKVSKNNNSLTAGTNIGDFKVSMPTWKNLSIVGTDYIISSNSSILHIIDKATNNEVATFLAAITNNDTLKIICSGKSILKFPRCGGTLKIPIVIKKDSNTNLTIYRTAKFKILNVSEDGSSYNLLINSVTGRRGCYTISANQILGSEVIDLTNKLKWADDIYDVGDLFVTTDRNVAVNNSVDTSLVITIKNTTTLYLCKATSNDDPTKFDILDTETIIGIDDVQGLTGKVIRFRGDWNTLVGPNASSNSVSFEGYGDPDGKYIDIVTSGDLYYQCLNSETFQTNPLIGEDFPTQENFEGHLTKNWVRTEKSEIVATKVLLADNAAIKFNQGLEIRLQDDDECIVGGARGGKHDSNDIIFWAGSLMNPNPLIDVDQIDILDSPFQVLKDGTLKASKAEISGKITDKQGISVISPTQELYIGFDEGFNPEIALYSRSEGLRGALQWNLASLTSAIYYLQSLGGQMSCTEYPNWYFISTSWLPKANLGEGHNLTTNGIAYLDKDLYNELMGNLLQSNIPSEGWSVNTIIGSKCLVGPFTLYLTKTSEIQSVLDLYRLDDPKKLIYAEYWGRLFTIPMVKSLISTNAIMNAKNGDTTSELNIYHELVSNCPARIYGDGNNAIGFYLGTKNINGVPGCHNDKLAANMVISPSKIYKNDSEYRFEGYRFIEGDRSVISNGEGYNTILRIDLIY